MILQHSTTINVHLYLKVIDFKCIVIFARARARVCVCVWCARARTYRVFHSKWRS